MIYDTFVNHYYTIKDKSYKYLSHIHSYNNKGIIYYSRFIFQFFDINNENLFFISSDAIKTSKKFHEKCVKCVELPETESEKYCIGDIGDVRLNDIQNRTQSMLYIYIHFIYYYYPCTH